jgi:hypothetical protein
LRPLHDSDNNIIKSAKAVGDELQAFLFAEPRFTADQGKSTIHDQVLEPEEESVHSRRQPQRVMALW